jgi:flagella basal body P-ring formation protein FlgA
MMLFKSALIYLLLSGVVAADIVSPTRTIRADTIIGEDDVTVLPGSNANAFEDKRDVIGQEAKNTLYAGRPIHFDDIGPPALVMRNQIVSLQFRSGSLIILTEGRSLERGGVGDHVRVMNLSSRTTLFGQVQSDGTIEVLN